MKLSLRSLLGSSKPRRLFSSLLVKDGRIYNQCLDLKVGSSALSAQTFFNLASMDAQAQSRNVEDHLAIIKSNAAIFFEGSEFHDRKQLVAAVSDVLTSEGEFELLLGGKITGLLCDIISLLLFRTTVL